MQSKCEIIFSSLWKFVILADEYGYLIKKNAFMAGLYFKEFEVVKKILEKIQSFLFLGIT